MSFETKNAGYEVSVSYTEVGDLTYSRWKLEQAPGNYEQLMFTAKNVREAFSLLCEHFKLKWYKDATGTAHGYNKHIFLTHGSHLAIQFHESKAAQVAAILATIPRAKPESSIKWWYMGVKEPEGITMPLEGFSPTDEFYPWMSKSIATFAREYSESSANVLLLLGQPGTGKTSFIRGLIREMSYETWVTYDSKVQQNEQFYIQFTAIARNADIPASLPEELRDGSKRDDGRCLVLEDADEMLSKRTEGNKIMNRLLNLSDGLVSLPARKIIFSTNLPGLKSVDEALLRPGRCFAAIKFRDLTRAEAQRACRSVGIDRAITKEKLTLSEALNGHQEMNIGIQHIGF